MEYMLVSRICVMRRYEVDRVDTTNRVFLETRIAMSRKHFTVGVDIDPCSFSGFKDRLEVVHIVSADQ